MHSFCTNTVIGILLLTLISISSGCELVNESPEETSEPPSGVYIANQGNFSDANGTISLFRPLTGTISNDAVPNLGSIVQSIQLIGESGYIASNSANRIDVFETATRERTAQIDSINSPRYIAAVSDTTAYVTNFYNGTVTLIDLQSNSQIDTIGVGANPEGLTALGNRAFVANHGLGSGSTVSVIDLSTHAVTQTVDAECDGPRTVLPDDDGEIWVFCTGNTVYDDEWNIVEQTNGSVTILNGENGSVASTIPLEGQISTAGPGQDAFHAPQIHTMYAVIEQERVVRFDTRTNSGPSDVAIPEGAPIGTVAYDGSRDRLYLGRTPGFDESGTVQLFTPGDTTSVEEYTAGVAPVDFAFDRE